MYDDSSVHRYIMGTSVDTAQNNHQQPQLTSSSSSSLPSSSGDGRVQSLSLLSDCPMVSPSLTAIYSLQVLYNPQQPPSTFSHASKRPSSDALSSFLPPVNAYPLYLHILVSPIFVFLLISSPFSLLACPPSHYSPIRYLSFPAVPPFCTGAAGRGQGRICVHVPS